jgi:hypothetical protein
MHKGIYITILFSFLFNSCSFPTTKQAGIKYSTQPAFQVPEDINWREVGIAKELININEKMVIISGGSNPLQLNQWEELKVRYPWKKNIDRHILIKKTALVRSPNASPNCNGSNCLIERDYKSYSWIELAQPLAIDFIPSKTNMLKPQKGYLVVKIIKKCQILCFENEIYQLTDNKGNYYVMHATETVEPNLNVILPKGWSLNKVDLQEPLVILPFGKGEDCYFNIVGDHLGQGYHQYRYANAYYPE